MASLSYCNSSVDSSVDSSEDDPDDDGGGPVPTVPGGDNGGAAAGTGYKGTIKAAIKNVKQIFVLAQGDKRNAITNYPLPDIKNHTHQVIQALQAFITSRLQPETKTKCNYAVDRNILTRTIVRSLVPEITKEGNPQYELQHFIDEQIFNDSFWISLLQDEAGEVEAGKVGSQYVRWRF